MSINKNSTLFILDWDDTLFPTSWITQHNINITSLFFENDKFKILDNILSSFLLTISNLGDIVIITNAYTEWVNFSSRIVPTSRNIINNIRIISARQQFNSVSPNTMDWKKFAFLNENLTKYNNIISIGDAQYEYQALVNLYHYTANKLLKSIRFIPYSNINSTDKAFDIIIDQIEILNKNIKKICLSSKHYDLSFKIY